MVRYFTTPHPPPVSPAIAEACRAHTRRRRDRPLRRDGTNTPTVCRRESAARRRGRVNRGSIACSDCRSPLAPTDPPHKSLAPRSVFPVEDDLAQTVEAPGLAGQLIWLGVHPLVLELQCVGYAGACFLHQLHENRIYCVGKTSAARWFPKSYPKGAD